MHLTQREQERLMIFVAAEVARKRRARGLRLNYPEAMAILTGDDVMPGIAEMIHEVQVEATFPDGTKLVTVHDPIQ